MPNFFGLRTSDFGLRTSDFGLRTSDFGLKQLPFNCFPEQIFQLEKIFLRY